MADSVNHSEGKKRWVVFAGFRLDAQTYQLFSGDKKIPLPARAGQVLELLAQSPGQLISRSTIGDAIWGSQHLDLEASLNTAIRAARRALGDDANNPSFIETVPRHGYRFLQQPDFLNETSSKPPTFLHKRYLKIAVMLLLIIPLTYVVLTSYLKPGSQTEADSLHHYVNSAGYEDFLRGQYALTNGEQQQAKTYLEKAIQADPTLGPAYTALARIYVGQRKFGWNNILEAQKLVDRALLEDPNLASANALNAAIALYYWRDREKSREYLERVRALIPEQPDALVVEAYLNVVEENPASALSAITKAHEIRPLSASLNADYGWVLYKLGKWVDAEHLCKTSHSINRNSQFALECIIHINHSQGDNAEVADYGLKLMALRGATKAEIASVRQESNAELREQAFWQWTLKWLESAEVPISDPYSKRGIALTMLNRQDEAVNVFEQGYNMNGEPFLAFLAKDPRVEQLRNHPDFGRLADLSRSKVPRAN